jgi:DNA-binding protein WhiA
MSFSADVKNELANNISSACCYKAEAFGMLLFGRAFGLSEISLMTEFQSVAERYSSSVRDLTGVTPQTQRSGAGKYKVTIPTREDRIKILTYFGYTGKELSLRINLSNLEQTNNDCCSRAFLRGAFLVCGSVTDPEKDYHIELSVTKAKLCDDLLQIIDDIGLKAKKIIRNNSYVIYSKDAESVEDFIGTMGANNAFLTVMQTRAMKNIKNQINRRSNFESANMSRSIEAGLKQVAVIEEVLNKISLDDMTEDLAALCKLRLENPELSLDEIGKMMVPELSRSAVSRRFKKLEKIAEEIKAK